MNLISKILAITVVMLSLTACSAQIKNAKTEDVKVYGNCGMCKAAIEKAGNFKKKAKVVWNKDTQTASITYNAITTNKDEVLKRIALSGYDNENFLAPDNVYSKLPECCQYERIAKTAVKVEIPTKNDSMKMKMHNHDAMTETKQDVPQLQAVFDNYFAIKDALVKTDGSTASNNAKELQAAIDNVKMEKLSIEEHEVWMKVMKELAFDARHIAEDQSAEHQREHFTTLSKNMYALIKVSKQETPTYFQHCPMYNDGQGADWLSKENAIKNPYYGSQMLTCGKTVETIK